MNLVEYWADGSTLARTVQDLGDGTAVVSVYDQTGSLVSTETVTVTEPAQEPLDHAGALAALLACLNVVPVVDAANAVGVTPDQLEAEVLAWEVAGAALGGP